MQYKIAVVLFALLAFGIQTKNCDEKKENKMNNQPLAVKAECKGNEQCLFTGEDMFFEIKIFNQENSEIGVPLDFIKDKGPITKLIDTRTGADTFLPTHPPDGDLREKFTYIKPGESVKMDWVITAEELREFGGDVDLTVEFTIMAEIFRAGKKEEFKGSDRIRIVEKK